MKKATKIITLLGMFMLAVSVVACNSGNDGAPVPGQMPQGMTAPGAAATPVQASADTTMPVATEAAATVTTDTVDEELTEAEEAATTATETATAKKSISTLAAAKAMATKLEKEIEADTD